MKLRKIVKFKKLLIKINELFELFLLIQRKIKVFFFHFLFFSLRKEIFLFSPENLINLLIFSLYLVNPNPICV